MQLSAFVSSAENNLQIRELDPTCLPPTFVQEWVDLEARSLEPNLYLSPHFCLPAIRHLAAEVNPFIIAIYTEMGEKTLLVGLAVVVLHPPSRDFPLTHLVCFESIHSYLGGILLDRTHANTAADTFFKFLTKAGAPWHGLRINHWCSSAKQSAVMRAAARSHAVYWHEMQSYERACLEPSISDDAAYQKSYEIAGGKDLDRRVRRLKELGEVSTRVLRGKAVTEQVIEKFLLLEDREWTRETKTSLLAAGHAQFFREVCQPLADESRIFVSEILINNEAVASALNFISGNCGFAFKIGWDQKLAKMSPGIINELWFMRDVAQSCADLQQIDSGASSGSFIEKIWSGRKTISSGIFVTSRRANWTLRGIDIARSARDRWHKLRGP